MVHGRVLACGVGGDRRCWSSSTVITRSWRHRMGFIRAVMGRRLTLFAPHACPGVRWCPDIIRSQSASPSPSLCSSPPPDHSAAVNCNHIDHLSIRDRKQMTHDPRCILALTSTRCAISLSLRGDNNWVLTVIHFNLLLLFVISIVLHKKTVGQVDQSPNGTAFDSLRLLLELSKSEMMQSFKRRHASDVIDMDQWFGHCFR